MNAVPAKRFLPPDHTERRTQRAGIKCLLGFRCRFHPNNYVCLRVYTVNARDWNLFLSLIQPRQSDASLADKSRGESDHVALGGNISHATPPASRLPSRISHLTVHRPRLRPMARCPSILPKPPTQRSRTFPRHDVNLALFPISSASRNRGRDL